MTAIDEISYRTPDALFNGEAVTGVIQSCIPAVKDAWATPGTDLDVLLVAIRIASYGHSMDVGTVCPSCGEEHEFGLDLRTVIDNLKAGDFEQPLTVGDLTFHFRPLSYREMTNNSLQQFEQQKTLQMVNQDTTITESDKITRMNQMMKSLVEVTVKAISQSITEIRTPGAIVTEQKYIEEFVTNCDRTIFNAIRDYVIKLRESSELKPLEITCPSCTHQYQQIFTMDMANFFVAAS
jgi:bacterioferritin-associated ferredoxin